MCPGKQRWRILHDGLHIPSGYIPTFASTGNQPKNTRLENDVFDYEPNSNPADQHSNLDGLLVPIS